MECDNFWNRLSLKIILSIPSILPQSRIAGRAGIARIIVIHLDGLGHLFRNKRDLTIQKTKEIQMVNDRIKNVNKNHSQSDV